jgi:deoxyribonuclease-4
MSLPLVFGWHSSVEKVDEIQEIHAIYQSGWCPTAQIFTKPPMQVSSISKRKEKIQALRPLLDHTLLFVHSSYLINYIRPDGDSSLISVVDDILFLDEVTPDQNKSHTGVVIHLGKNVEHLSLEQCIKNFTENVREVLEQTSEQKVRLILETSTRSKNGNDVFWDIKVFGELCQNIKKALGEEVYHSRIGFCIDTAHVFASGYDLRTKEKVREFLSLWDEHIGVQRITLIHLNDSKVGVGCCRDLHQQLGKGYIYSEEKEGLQFLLEWCRRSGTPVISETGGDMMEEMELVKSLLN